VNRDGLALAGSRSFVGSGPQLPTDYDEECSAGNAITLAIVDLYDSSQKGRANFKATLLLLSSLTNVVQRTIRW